MKKIEFVLLLLPLAALSCSITFDDFAEDANYVDFNKAEERGEESSLKAEIDLKIGQLEIEAGPLDKAYELDLHYNDSAFQKTIDYSVLEGQANLRFELTGEGRSVRNMGDTRLSLRLNPETPVDLYASTGVVESTIDLTEMSVQSLVMEGGVGETELTMFKPNGTRCNRLEVSTGVGSLEIIGLGNFDFEDFQFQGGVGAATLDFSGEWGQPGEVEIEVGVGGVEIQVPRDVGAEDERL